MRGRELSISRHFFKVMMPGFLTKLSLPPAFCRRLNGENSEEAILTSCEGTWHVKAGKCSKGLICFNEGWDKFVDHHGLDLGDFVVFEHKGDLHFNVSVFDPSACEKEFPVKLGNDQTKEAPGVQVFGKTEFPAKLGNDQRKRAHDDQVFDPSTCKKEFPAKLGNDQIKTALGVRVFGKEEYAAKLGKDQIKRAPDVQVFVPSTCEKEFPIKLGNVQRKREFGDQAFDPNACEKEFPAKLGNDKRKTAPADQVNIHKHAKHIKKNPLEEAASYTAGSPYFITTIAACNGISNQPYMNIPAGFLRANDLSEYCSLTLRDPLGKSWPVKLSFHYGLPGKLVRTSMTKGWHEFYASNKLKKGDVCIFELNRATTTTRSRSEAVVMDVRIFPLQI